MGKVNGKDYFIEIYNGESRGNSFVSRKKLIENHYYLVKQIAGGIKRGINGRGDLDDLVGDGSLGLIDAAEKYDVNKSVLFRVYARTRIRGAIFDGLRNGSVLPRSMQVKVRLINKVYSVLGAELNREPEEEEVINELAKDCYYVSKAFKARGTVKARKILEDVANRTVVYRLDDLIKNEENQEGRSRFSDFTYNEGDKPFVRLDFERILDGLSECEKGVMKMYYKEDLILKEVGEVLDLTESRICQIHKAAIKKIKKRLDRIGQDYEEGLKIVCK